MNKISGSTGGQNIKTCYKHANASTVGTTIFIKAKNEMFLACFFMFLRQ